MSHRNQPIPIAGLSTGAAPYVKPEKQRVRGHGMPASPELLTGDIHMIIMGPNVQSSTAPFNVHKVLLAAQSPEAFHDHVKGPGITWHCENILPEHLMANVVLWLYTGVLYQPPEHDMVPTEALEAYLICHRIDVPLMPPMTDLILLYDWAVNNGMLALASEVVSVFHEYLVYVEFPTGSVDGGFIPNDPEDSKTWCGDMTRAEMQRTIELLYDDFPNIADNPGDTLRHLFEEYVSLFATRAALETPAQGLMKVMMDSIDGDKRLTANLKLTSMPELYSARGKFANSTEICSEYHVHAERPEQYAIPVQCVGGGNNFLLHSHYKMKEGTRGGVVWEIDQGGIMEVRDLVRSRRRERNEQARMTTT